MESKNEEKSAEKPVAKPKPTSVKTRLTKVGHLKHDGKEYEPGKPGPDLSPEQADYLISIGVLVDPGAEE